MNFRQKLHIDKSVNTYTIITTHQFSGDLKTSFTKFVYVTRI